MREHFLWDAVVLNVFFSDLLIDSFLVSYLSFDFIRFDAQGTKSSFLTVSMLQNYAVLCMMK